MTAKTKNYFKETFLKKNLKLTIRITSLETLAV